MKQTAVQNRPLARRERGIVMRGKSQAIHEDRSAFGRLMKRHWLPVAFILMVVVALVDLTTGYELSFSLFYLLPIAVVAWYGDRGTAAAACSVGAIVWTTIDVLAGRHYSNTLVWVWNTGIRFGFLVIVASLLERLRAELLRAQDLAEVDYLTGAMSPGSFYETLQAELNRCQRFGRPLTLAYFDLDDFKRMNDQFGHSAGDEVLRRVVSSTNSRLRSTDVVARMGGDEFAILLPETDMEGAQAVLPEVQTALRDEMRSNGWPVTVSIGVVSFTETPSGADDALCLADELMYAAKSAGKDSIRYSAYPARLS